MKNKFYKLLDYVDDHNRWMDCTINLVASYNKLSPHLEKCLMSDIGNRVAEGWLGERLFPGLYYYDKIEEYGMELVKEIYSADFVDLRPTSGTLANMVIYTAFTSPGDTIVAPSISVGGHVSMSGAVPKKVFKLNVVEFPFLEKEFNIDKEASIKLIREVKPKIIVMGGSVILFKQPVREISEVAKEVGAILLFDAAHVAGLIAGGCFPNPLKEGADIMTLTTCKTIPGPQHAFILANKEYSEKIRKTTFPALLAGHHLHETVASILAMEEFKVFGKKYAEQVKDNTQALANQLATLGFDIICKNGGFTETHMFLLNISKVMKTKQAEKLLEMSNIIVNRNMLPADEFASPSGLRFGTPEVTRIGMKEVDMRKIAEFIHDVLIKGIDYKDINKRVVEFRKAFPEVQYCFPIEK